MTPEQELRAALAEEFPDWHPEVQRLVQQRVAELEAALYNHGYGAGLCRCEWCAALVGDGGGASADPQRPQNDQHDPTCGIWTDHERCDCGATITVEPDESLHEYWPPRGDGGGA